MAEPEPQKVRLTSDYLNLAAGHGYPAGTVLIRSPHGTGQYLAEGEGLGGWCVSHYDLIRDISEPIP